MVRRKERLGTTAKSDAEAMPAPGHNDALDLTNTVRTAIDEKKRKKHMTYARDIRNMTGIYAQALDQGAYMKRLVRVLKRSPSYGGEGRAAC